MHWFDGLAQPHTRRTVVKAGALAGAAALMPGVRVPAARAASTEPCYGTCRDIAKTTWRAAYAVCDREYNLRHGQIYLSLLQGVGPSVLTTFISLGRGYDCLNSADLGYVGESQECRKPQCGDRAKYPGGNAPVTLCKDYPGYLPCGPTALDCCDSKYAECCQCKSKLICCRLGAECSCCGSSG